MIRGAVADLNSIVTKLNQVKGLSNGDD
jgi:hypothetical protein